MASFPDSGQDGGMDAAVPLFPEGQGWPDNLTAFCHGWQKAIRTRGAEGAGRAPAGSFPDQDKMATAEARPAPPARSLLRAGRDYPFRSSARRGLFGEPPDRRSAIQVSLIWPRRADDSESTLLP